MSEPTPPPENKPQAAPPVKSPDPPQGYRSAMEREDTSSRGALGTPLITINPKDLDAQTRVPSVMALATHAVIAAVATGEDTFKTKEGVSFNIETLGGTMGLFEFEYEKKAISADGGKGRQEYIEVSKLEALGPNEDSSLAQSVLNEGAKNLTGKDKGKK